MKMAPRVHPGRVVVLAKDPLATSGPCTTSKFCGPFVVKTTVLKELVNLYFEGSWIMVEFDDPEPPPPLLTLNWTSSPPSLLRHLASPVHEFPAWTYTFSHGPTSRLCQPWIPRASNIWPVPGTTFPPLVRDRTIAIVPYSTSVGSGRSDSDTTVIVGEMYCLPRPMTASVSSWFGSRRTVCNTMCLRPCVRGKSFWWTSTRIGPLTSSSRRGS